MPTINNYNYAFFDWGSDPNEAKLTGKPRKIFPVDGDSTIYILEEDYTQLIEAYAPLAPATRHDTYLNVFFSKDTPIRDIGNGLGAYTRTWVSLPGYDETGTKTSYVSVDWTSYVMQVPGIANSPTGSVTLNTVVSGYNSNGIYIATTQAAHGIVANDFIKFDYYIYDPISKGKLLRSVYRVAKAGTAGSTVNMAAISDINTIFPLAIYKTSQYVLPYPKVVAAKIVKDYWLVGVGGLTANEDIPLIDQFTITDLTTGAKSDYLGTLTIPTLAAYVANIDAGEWLCVESSTLERWQNSPIMERRTKYVKYQL